MSYDVFLVSALEDRDIAKLITRRLRALKFRVWLDQKQEDDTFDAKDARDAMNSQSMLVLWSENALKSDWVRAAASIGHSRPGTLIEASLDSAIPYEPFRAHMRYALEGMTSRKTPDSFISLVEELGARQDRKDLRAWMGYGAQDEDQRVDWLAAHPNDPLALDARKKREKDLGIKPAPAREAIGAAALAAASMRATSAAPAPAPAVLSRPVGAAPLASNGAVASATLADDALGWGTLTMVGLAIGAMLLMAWAFRSQTVSPLQGSLPAIANARLVPNACPAGTVPRAMLRVLEPGTIIDDTKPPLETGPIIDDTTPPN
jgi:TIR domain